MSYLDRTKPCAGNEPSVVFGSFQTEAVLFIMKTGLGEPDLRHRIRNIDASLRLVIDKNLNYAPRSLLHIGRRLKHNISLPLRGASHANVRMSWLARGNSMAREPRLARANGRKVPFDVGLCR
jgi:hypothetical protein